MGYAECDSDSCAFLTDLDAHRELVANEFDKLLGGFQETMQSCEWQPRHAKFAHHTKST